MPVLVRPWSEVNSRRRVSKRVNAAGLACPNSQCQYFGITDAHIHALLGDGKHSHAERIQTFRCQTCRTTFTALNWLYGISVRKQAGKELLVKAFL